MVDGEVLEGKRLAAAIAEALLLAEEMMLVLSGVVGREIAEVGALRDVGAVDAVVEESQFVLESRLNQFRSLG